MCDFVEVCTFTDCVEIQFLLDFTQNAKKKVGRTGIMKMSKALGSVGAPFRLIYVRTYHNLNDHVFMFREDRFLISDEDLSQSV